MPKQRANLVHAGFGFRFLPEIEATEEQAAAIRRIVDRALVKSWKPQLGSSPADFFDRDPVAAVEKLVSHLVSEHRYSTGVAEFRRMVRKHPRGELRSAVQQLIKVLPGTHLFPPFQQMRAVFAGGNPFATDLGAIGNEEKQREWQAKFGPSVLRTVLLKYVELLDELDVRSRGTRPAEVPERTFVFALAAFWTGKLGLKPSESRAGGQPRGDFRDFVETAASLCPPDVKLRAQTTFIRQACNKYSVRNGRV
jgi:hypothetical protein